MRSRAAPACCRAAGSISSRWPPAKWWPPPAPSSATTGTRRAAPGGTVELRKSGAPLLDYTTPPRVWEGLREGVKAIARADLAVGAQRLVFGPEPGLWIESERDLAKIDQMDIARSTLFSAHVMG